MPAPLVQRRFVTLLGALALLLLAAPLFGASPRGEGELALLFSVVIFGLVAAAERRRRVALGLAGLWLALTWVVPAGELASDAVLLALCVVAIESVLAHVLTASRVDGEVLAAAIAAYVLMGIAWAVVYTMLETVAPGTFRLSQEAAAAPWSALLYFSFATLTTVGYGDVTPASAVAQAWTMVEAMGGTLYLAILIARLVGAYQADTGESP